MRALLRSFWQAVRHPDARTVRLLLASAACLAILIGLGAWAIISQGPGSGPTQVATDDAARGKFPAAKGQTACFSVTVPSDAMAKDTGSCNLTVTTAEGRLSIRPLVGEGRSAGTHADLWKEIAGRSDFTIGSEQSLKVGGNKAVRFVYQRQSNGTDQALWVIATGERYKINGKVPDGFEAAGDYHGAAKATAEAILASLQWK